MVRIPDYFYSTDFEKQTLHRRITPSQDQKENQQVKWNDLCDFLKDKLNQETNYSIESWIQGSYKIKTQVRPTSKDDDFDIDLGIYFEWKGEPEDGNFSPKELKDFVQDELKKYGEDDPDVIQILEPPKKRCSRIKFKDNFHIDVPSYHEDKDSDKRKLATEDDIWEESDPKAFYSWFIDKFEEDENRQVRRIIKYFKILTRLHLKNPPSSVLLTVLVSEAYKSCSEEEVNGDDLAIKSVAEKIISRLENSIEVKNPVNSNEDLNRLRVDEIDLFFGLLDDVVNTADSAFNSSSEATTSIIWGNMFKHFFPITDSMETGGEKSLVPMKFIPDVLVTADSTKTRTFFNKTGHNGIDSIPADCRIQFFLTNYNQLPVGSKISWMVRNEGSEAEYKNDLGHVGYQEISKPYLAEEHSSYAGTHFMDISITSAIGEILGFRRIPVGISGQFFPPRNKPRKFNGVKR